MAQVDSVARGPVRPQRRVVEAADNSCDGNVLTSCRADKLTPTTTSCLPLEWRESYVGVDGSIQGRITVYFHNGDNVTVFKCNSQIRILSLLYLYYKHNCVHFYVCIILL